MKDNKGRDQELFARLDKFLPDSAARPISPLKSELADEIDISGLPEGKWIARGVYKMEREIPYGRQYGHGLLDDPSCSGELLSFWGGMSRSVYLDLETTGLSGAKGAYAFLVGLGFNTEDSFKVVQLFMAGPAWEKNLLWSLESELPSHDYGLVTYNGKAFDLPLLRIRYRLAKSSPGWDSRPHMDLLMMSRLFYRGRISSCSLSSIEKTILGVHRSGEDVPGREIPGIYTSYLSSSDASPLRGVFYHNTLDVISMAVLQKHIGSLADMRGRSGKDLLRCGDLWAQAKNAERAKGAWTRALDFRGSESEANMRLAEMAKNEGDFNKAKELYIEALKQAPSSPSILENLSKIDENDTKEIRSALSYAEKALEIMETMEDENGVSSWQQKYVLNNRIARLRRKCGDRE
ncbi:MAG: ribonuclease H-like domain-containing protein [Synergistaceae bacterium]|nr:ribonuclease H-like domain-containing protein [Synergistaceae bacterium]